MATFILPTLHAGQALLSGYGLYTSYTSITNLQQYESTSEKAAEYLSAAAHQLHKTRTTQASGALAILTSLLTSLALLALPASLSAPTAAAVNVSVAGLALAAMLHVGNFWRGKARVPFVEGYNEGMRRTEELRRVLGWLAMSWAATGVGGLVQAVWAEEG
ncbi:hypothetical protein MMC26_004014 [Xylographa opegraphella]|nr:hypothetical protein [Xylographa opegraphella]